MSAQHIPSKLTARFSDALIYAYQLHATQTRKGTDTPYISHLLGVTALVLEDGGDEDQAIAALLHDAVEDQGGLSTLQDIHDRFGERVATIVEGCTDAFTMPKPPWRDRKVSYLSHLRLASGDVRRVSLADKLHNARTILSDLRHNGPRVFNRFSGGKEGTLWYYRSLVKAFEDFGVSPMLEELARVVAEIETLALSNEQLPAERQHGDA